MRTWVEISRERLARNYRNICAAVAPGAAVAGVVKANAYGHGAVEVARVLAAQGAEWLAVSNTAEGRELRRAGLGGRILVLGGVLREEREALRDARLTPAVHALDELREWDAMGMALAVHLKVDTGMARLGLRDSPEEIRAAVSSLRSVKVEGLMSHFASPSEPVQSGEQMERFAEIVGVIRPEVAHFASSFALDERMRGSWLTLVRPGIALYGYAPVCDVAPILTWKARVLAVKELPAGVPVGYGARYRAERPMRMAVIAAGYADGIPRTLTNRGSVEIGGQLAPMIGAVSMDLTTIDVTEGARVRVGDEAVIVGRLSNAEDMARAAGTISYEILTGIGNRVERVYNNSL